MLKGKMAAVKQQALFARDKHRTKSLGACLHFEHFLHSPRTQNGSFEAEGKGWCSKGLRYQEFCYQKAPVLPRRLSTVVYTQRQVRLALLPRDTEAQLL